MQFLKSKFALQKTMASSATLIAHHITASPNHYISLSQSSTKTRITSFTNLQTTPSLFLSLHSRRSVPLSSHSPSNVEEEDDGLVQDLRVPQQWMDPSNAAQESEWLRAILHKWLDDEYCPEPTNVDISNIAAQSYYKSLVEKETDLGEILLKMARDLESISYQESFHGAFSSANAAINLIIQKIEQV